MLGRPKEFWRSSSCVSRSSGAYSVLHFPNFQTDEIDIDIDSHHFLSALVLDAVWEYRGAGVAR